MPGNWAMISPLLTVTTPLASVVAALAAPAVPMTPMAAMAAIAAVLMMRFIWLSCSLLLVRFVAPVAPLASGAGCRLLCAPDW